MYLTPNPDIRLDEFIHDQDFQVYMDMTIDKTFVEDFATIKTTLGLSVKLINENKITFNRFLLPRSHTSCNSHRMFEILDNYSEFLF